MKIQVRPMTDEEKAAAIQRFKSNCECYDTLIRKCFIYLYTRRFPSQEGDKDAFNLLWLRLYELDVFGKFDIKKVVAKRKGLDKKKAHTISDSECTLESLKKLGINSKKKFEQFLFKQIEHILSEAYDQRLKYSRRFVRDHEMAEEPPQSFSELRTRLNENCWAQSRDEMSLLEDYLSRKERQSRVKTYPTCEDKRNYVGKPAEDPLDELVGQDLNVKLRAVATSKKEKRVLELVMEGLKGSEIAFALKCTPQSVNLVIKNIRQKFVQYMQQEAVLA